MSKKLVFKWGVSRGRDTYGYNICSLYVDGQKVSSCNGGGYDMQGTSLGYYIARAFADRLLTLKPEDMPEQVHYDHEAKKRVNDGRYFYGLTFHDPDYDPGKAVIGKDTTDRTLSQESEGKTVEQAEQAGESLGLERYQAFYKASAKHPSKTHKVPLIDGACGIDEVRKIMQAIGLELEYIHKTSKETIYTMHDSRD